VARCPTTHGALVVPGVYQLGTINALKLHAPPDMRIKRLILSWPRSPAQKASSPGCATPISRAAEAHENCNSLTTPSMPCLPHAGRSICAKKRRCCAGGIIGLS